MTIHEVFKRELARAQPRGSRGKRRWIFVPHDQLHDGFGILVREKPQDLGIVLVESRWWAGRRPHHRQKLALVWANQRHFALEQARRGVAVRYEPTRRPLREKLRDFVEELGPLEMMEAAEREMRADVAPLVGEGLLRVVPHEGWLTTKEDFARARTRSPHWFMDAFYKAVRRRTGILMHNGKPVGGQFSFDAENRKPWKGSPKPPIPPVFVPDAITREVGEMIESDYARHPGTVDLGSLPATREDAERLWQWVKDEVLEHFGPYEDAMSRHSSGLFHSRLSSLINVHRILPRAMVEEVAGMEIPLASKEGFLRQVLGWREFVKHVHEATDGFRELPGGERPPVLSSPGDGGWNRWVGRSWDAGPEVDGVDGGAMPSLLEADEPLPPTFWGAPSGMACLDTVVGDVWREAWSHHITRLMILSNIATLLGVSPRELTDWFWVAYADAWDWVVEPNVLGMGTFALGEVMTTKPYVSGAAYVSKMSDYCETCAFDPKKDCPLASLYWAFLDRNRKHLEGNVRVAMPMRSLAKRSAEKLAQDRAVRSQVLEKLRAGAVVTPDDLRE